MDRRQFLQRSAAGGLATVFVGSGGYWLQRRNDVSRFEEFAPMYGALEAAGPSLALPRGFSHREVSVEGRPMSDGQPTPPLPDGMAAFSMPNGNIRLLRNHEIGNVPVVGWDRDPATLYDPMAWGGVSALEIDPATRDVVADFAVLAGTVRNCSGGATPWRSWLTCEETLSGRADGYDRLHGYVFEVPADADGPVNAEPLRGLGRFIHESVAVCATVGAIYQTEDFETVPFYRWTPKTPPTTNGRMDLEGAGRLEALIVPAIPGLNLTEATTTGMSWATSWVPIEEPDPDIDVSRERAEAEGIRPPVAAEGLEKGAAVFRRLEGCAVEDGVVWFTSTNGGHGHGQVWRYEPTDRESGRLTLVYVSPAKSVLRGPDNLCRSPGGAVVLCEDGDREPTRVVALTAEGLIVPLVENIGDDEEFAGASFSPDGRTLFVNLMGDRDDGLLGRTFAIWGPWHQGPV